MREKITPGRIQFLVRNWGKSYLHDYNEAYRLRDHRIYLDSLCNQFSAVLVADAVRHAEGNNAINK